MLLDGGGPRNGSAAVGRGKALLPPPPRLCRARPRAIVPSMRAVRGGASGAVGRVFGQRSCAYRTLLGAAGCMVVLGAALLVLSVVVGAWSAERQKEGPGGERSAIQIGDEAPAFSLPAADGGTVDLRELRGTPVLVNFWATWCLPCRLEEPALARAERQHGHALEILAVNQGEPADVVAAYARERGLAYRVLVDPDGEVGRAYGLIGMPTTIWVDAQGRLAHVDHGVLTDERIERQVEALAGGGR